MARRRGFIARFFHELTKPYQPDQVVRNRRNAKKQAAKKRASVNARAQKTIEKEAAQEAKARFAAAQRAERAAGKKSAPARKAPVAARRPTRDDLSVRRTSPRKPVFGGSPGVSTTPGLPPLPEGYQNWYGEAPEDQRAARDVTFGQRLGEGPPPAPRNPPTKQTGRRMGSASVRDDDPSQFTQESTFDDYINASPEKQSEMVRAAGLCGSRQTNTGRPCLNRSTGVCAAGHRKPMGRG